MCSSHLSKKDVNMISYFIYGGTSFLILIGCCQTIGDRDFIESTQYSEPVGIIRQRRGSDVKLKCPSSTKDDSSTPFSWEFKICEMVDDLENCYWSKSNITNKKNLEIRNLGRKNNGEYRCSVNDSVRKVFLVEIAADLFEGMPPRIMSLDATNMTVPENGTTFLKCRVKSADPPDIFWFRDCYGQLGHTCNTIKIEEQEDCYCLITVSQSVPVVRNEYLSKLKISQMTATDSGLYTCLALSLYGSDHKNLTIAVLEQNMSVDISVTWLILMPVLFFLIPLNVWISCYFLRKRRKIVQRNIIEQQKKLIQPHFYTNNIVRTPYLDT